MILTIRARRVQEFLDPDPTRTRSNNFFLDPDPTRTRSNKLSGTRTRTRKDPIDQFILDFDFVKFLMKFFNLIQ